MAMTTETKVERLTNSSIHEIEGTITYIYHNNESRFTVLRSFDDAKEYLETNDESLIIIDFDEENDLNIFLEDCEVCVGCDKVCLPDDECYSDADTGDACCAKCCYYDEANDMYRKF